jgi:hypothetical protein
MGGKRYAHGSFRVGGGEWISVVVRSARRLSGPDGRAMKLRSALAVALSLMAFAVACSSGTEARLGSPIAKGEAAPGFALPSATGERVALSDFVGHKPVLLYFSMGPG